jgi:hypothetical protein
MTDMNARKEIAKLLDDQEKTRKGVNEIPHVIRARAASSAAQKASNEAQQEFSRIFDSYYRASVDASLKRKYPGILLLGDVDTGDEFRWIARCLVSGLPIFIGDLAYICGDIDTGTRTYILASAVQVKPEYSVEPQVVTELADEADDEEEEEAV